MGHILCSGSNDQTTKFWYRGRPSDANLVKCTTAHLQGSTSEQLGTQASGSLQTEGPSIPGLGIIRGAMSTLQLTEARESASNSLAVVQSHGPHPPSSTVNWSISAYQQHSTQFGQQDQQNQLQQMPQTQHVPGFSLPGQQHLALPQSQLRLIPQQSTFSLGGPPTAIPPQSLLSGPGDPTTMAAQFVIGIGIQGSPVRPRVLTAPIRTPLTASIPGSNISIDHLAGNAGLLASQLGIGGRLFRSNIVQGRIAALAPLVPYGASTAPLLSDQLIPAEANATNNIDAAHGQVLGMAINIPQHDQDGPGQHL